MVSNAKIAVGDVVQIHNWYGVVLETHHDAQGELSIIQVQTARNVFRGHGPEYIDVRLLPDAVEKATLDDLNREIAVQRRLQEGALQRLLTAVTADSPLPMASD